MEYLVKGTYSGNWNDLLVVSNIYKQHVTGNKFLFSKFKWSFGVEVLDAKNDFSFIHGVGESKIFINGKFRTISCISYVPKLNKNVLNAKQLLYQGFDIKYKGDVCYLEKMFGNMVMVQEDHELIMLNKKESNEEFKNMIYWFYGKHVCLGLDRPIPPTVKNGFEVELLDLYLYVEQSGEHCTNKERIAETENAESEDGKSVTEESEDKSGSSNEETMEDEDDINEDLVIIIDDDFLQLGK
ncbi:hypothetical protein L1987_01230 [Smallanthus sonchifolius]|uniref:Uncharacterized protein n=1 Tax=Smallanthus sonchifolius TaxID=185202 RepID=A0ACB9K4D1_9ASTR|nr:hypothetical protein L1987_01230 [Smallanthus sonchifolius]